jgi:hypothetical protein
MGEEYGTKKIMERKGCRKERQIRGENVKETIYR